MPETIDRLRTALAEHYTLEREAGRGGMATVFLARDRRHGRPVAIKVLKPELGAAIGGERFTREILIAANLNHPHILPVHDSGVADGLLYYVMPFVEGESLRERLDREYQLPLDDALTITEHVAGALEFAHSRGVIHRDIKPENILLQSGQAVVADFGIARAAEHQEGDRITHTGLAIGTPRYMSPEQAAGNTELDARSDLYSLACVLYEMLAGQPPHAAPTPQAILAEKLSQERPAELHALRSSVSPELDKVVMRALASTPADRYATCDEFFQALRAAAAGIPTEERQRRPSRARRPRNWRPVLLGAAGAITLLVAGFLLRPLLPSDTPEVNQLGIAVFPFRPTGGEAGEWSEALGDLLATALDGTPGVAVADPWTLWRALRPDRTAFAVAPAPDEAERLAARAGAGRFVIGTVVQTGGDLTLTARVYRAGEAEPGRALTVAGPADSLAALVQRLAVGVIRQVWEEDSLPDVRNLSGYTTRSAEALKAQLDARAAMRRGLVDSAVAYIDRAVALDSNFALALVDAVTIKAWAMWMRGQMFTGIMPLAERALTFADSLSERNRLRAEVAVATVRTDGVRAVEAARRIVQIDSTDLEGWNLLAYTHHVYGWQYGATPADARAAADRVVALDSSFVPGVVRRALFSATANRPQDLPGQLARLRQLDTTNTMVAGTMDALRALTAGELAYDSMVARVVQRPPPEWIPVVRTLRIQRPARAERLLRAVRAAAQAGDAANTARAELVRLLVAEGRLTEVDSMITAGEFNEVPWLHRNAQRWLVAAELAGVGDGALAARHVADLMTYIPVDSAESYFYNYPVWWTGWLIGAWHQTFGDPAVTSQWRAAIGRLPGGGTPNDYRGGLQRDLDARRFAARGNVDSAVAAAHDAFTRWSIHTENYLEALPEPAMRLHLAVGLRAQNRPDSAAALLRSLIPPGSWFGFLSARAAYELGELSEERRAWRDAEEYYEMALRLWDQGGAAVQDWRTRAQEGLARAARRTG